MKIGEQSHQNPLHNWICPDIRPNWKIQRKSDQFFLKELQGNRQLLLTPREASALTYFIGEYQLQQIQAKIHQEFGDTVSPNLVIELLEKLANLGVLTPPNNNSKPTPPSRDYRLKPEIQWFEHPDGHWILRNGEDFTFIQMDDFSKTITSDLGKLSPTQIIEKYDIAIPEFNQHLQLLANRGMLVGTKPQKKTRGKFTPLQLLYFILPLFNPDPWLTQHIDKLRWIWTRTFAFILCTFITYSTVVGLSQKTEIIAMGQKLWQYYGTSLILPFAILAMVVVSIHELSHAFTLKHYGGIVPEMGLFFMALIPSAYTDTTDGYCLMKRRQRVLVVAAGVLCQITIGAIALWLWNLSAADTWLHTGSYLLMTAALFTVAINLNPLSKFDGYYLAVALSGINNLRDRSFKFYTNLLTAKPIPEKLSVQVWLALYAPFSFAYLLFVFGFLLFRIIDWSLMNLFFWTLTLITLWAIYFYSPRTPMTATNNNATTNNSRSVSPAKEPPNPRLLPDTLLTSAVEVGYLKYLRFWLKLGLIASILIVCGFIPTSFEVGGRVELETREDAREIIRVPRVAVVKEITVKPGDYVQPGEIVAKLSSLELDREIATVEEQLNQAHQTLAAAKTEQIRAQAQLLEVTGVAAATEAKAKRERDRSSALIAGKLTPEIQILETQSNRLQEQIPEIEKRLQRYQNLYEQGAISRERKDNVESELKDIQSALTAKNQEIESAKQQQRDRATDLQNETSSQQTTIDASRMIAQAETQMTAQQNAIATIEKRLKQLQTQQESLTLRSTKAGVILTNDLDLRRNQELKPGEDLLLEIADLTELTATVEIKQEDLEYVEIDKPVTFRPLQAKLRPYKATVKRILPKIQNDPNQLNRVALIQIVVNNSDGKLNPGASGYAKIWSEQIPLYQRLGRELMRLVPLERFLWR